MMFGAGILVGKAPLQLQQCLWGILVYGPKKYTLRVVASRKYLCKPLIYEFLADCASERYKQKQLLQNR
jgi:hypothetical protein